MKKIASMNTNEILSTLRKIATLQTNLISKLAQQEALEIVLTPEEFKMKVHEEALKAMPGMNEQVFNNALQKNLTLQINPASKSVSWNWKFSKDPQQYGRLLNDACKSAAHTLGLSGDGNVSWG